MISRVHTTELEKSVKLSSPVKETASNKCIHAVTKIGSQRNAAFGWNKEIKRLL